MTNEYSDAQRAILERCGATSPQQLPDARSRLDWVNAAETRAVMRERTEVYRTSADDVPLRLSIERMIATGLEPVERMHSQDRLELVCAERLNRKNGAGNMSDNAYLNAVRLLVPSADDHTREVLERILNFYGRK